MNDPTVPNSETPAIDALSMRTSDPGGEFEVLLSRVHAGDQLAAEQLVNRYQPAVLRAVRSRLGKPMRGFLDSMDIVQSVHLSLLIGLHREKFQLRSPDQLIALAALMVQRKIARHWAHRKRSVEAKADGRAMAMNSLEQLPAPATTPSLIVSSQEQLAGCLATLDELDQQLVQLKLDGHTTAETAQLLARTPAFIRMRWTRLRQTLRKNGCLQ